MKNKKIVPILFKIVIATVLIIGLKSILNVNKTVGKVDTYVDALPDKDELIDITSEGDTTVILLKDAVNKVLKDFLEK